MKIKEKKKVLGGRGVVLTYANGNAVGQWFYREKIEGTKRYRNKKLEGAENIEQAEDMAMEAMIALRENEPHHKSRDAIPQEKIPTETLTLVQREEKLVSRKERLAREERKKEQPKMTVEKALDDWLKGQRKRVDAGTFEESSYSHKFHCCLHLRKYLKHKKVFFTSQIKTDTFDEYIEFRYQNAQRRLVIHRELAVIGEWIKSYLVRFKYIPAHLWLDGQFLPRIEIRPIDKDANPAINADDWKVILDYTRDVWRREAYEPTPITTSNQFHKNIQTNRKPEKKTV